MHSRNKEFSIDLSRDDVYDLMSVLSKSKALKAHDKGTFGFCEGRIAKDRCIASVLLRSLEIFINPYIHLDDKKKD